VRKKGRSKVRVSRLPGAGRGGASDASLWWDSIRLRLAQEWNRSSNQDNQQEAAVSGFERAIVYGWTVKSGDRGCSVTFTHGPERPWIAYTRSIDPPNEPGFWDSIEGMRWGADNPEGGPTEVNASLQGDGRVGLE